MIERIGIAGLVLLIAAGCGKSKEQEAAEAAAEQVKQGAEQLQQGAEAMANASSQSADQMAQGLQQMAQGFQQMAQGSAKPVDFEQLKGVLPEVPGWTRSDVRGEQVNMPVAVSRAEARFRKDEASIELEVMDTALSQLMLAPLNMFLAAGYEERSDDGFKRSTKIAGQTAFEEWNAKSKRGEVTILAANRFVVKATGRDVADLSPVRDLASAVNFTTLASLK